jgi:hypothetical protein
MVKQMYKKFHHNMEMLYLDLATINLFLLLIHLQSYMHHNMVYQFKHSKKYCNFIQKIFFRWGEYYFDA